MCLRESLFHPELGGAHGALPGGTRWWTRCLPSHLEAPQCLLAPLRQGRIGGSGRPGAQRGAGRRTGSAQGSLVLSLSFIAMVDDPGPLPVSGLKGLRPAPWGRLLGGEREAEAA